MNWSMRKTSLASVVIVAVALLGSACVNPGNPGVQVDARSAQLVFGVDDVESATAADEETQVEALEVAAPLPIEIPARRSSATPRPNRPRFTEVDFEIPPLFDETPRRPTICYAAIRKPSVKQPVTPQIQPGGLREGTYLWNGTATIGDPEQPTLVTGLEPHYRLIRNLENIGPQTPAAEVPSYRFEMVQRAGEAYGPGAFLVSTFQVNAPFDAQPAPPQVEQAAGTPRVRPPDSGVVLVKTELVDASGATFPGTRPFEPLVGVLLLPLDVKPGEKFNSSSADPATGKVVRAQSTVLNKARINACGEPVDGYLVRAAINISDNLDSDHDGLTSTGYVYRYVIAPQYGGLLLQEVVEVNPEAGVRASQLCTGQFTTPQFPTTTAPTTTTTAPGTTTTSSTSTSSTTSSTSTSSTTSSTSTSSTTSSTAPPPLVPAQKIDRVCTPQDYLVPPGSEPRTEVLHNIGFLLPTLEVPLSELP